MDTSILFVINTAQSTEFSRVPFANGLSALERVMAFAKKMAGKNVLAIDSDTKPHTMEMLLNEINSYIIEHKHFKNIIYVHSDCPFIDDELTRTLLDLHIRYCAEYTFADGYPIGFAPEIISTAVIPNLYELSKKYNISSDRKGLFELIQKDINSFDIETHLAPVDMRSYRFEPVCDCKRNMMAAEMLYGLGLKKASDIINILPNNLNLLRTVPAFFWVQITEACYQSCSYCPYPKMVGDPTKLKGFMPPEKFAKIINEAAILSDEFVVDISLWGEPSTHPHFEQLVDTILQYKKATLIVETSGIGWPIGMAEILAVKAGAAVQWIISLDDIDDASYKALRGDGKEEAFNFAHSMIKASPKTVHVQAVRMQQNEANLEAFYRYWKKLTDNVIIQKYDSFASSLPDKNVADISPLERLPCRHLARDMAILIDGSVVPCKHCLVPSDSGALFYADTLGNVFKDGLEKAWLSMVPWYSKHLSGTYPKPCGLCDEYHTFNA